MEIKNIIQQVGEQAKKFRRTVMHTTKAIATALVMSGLVAGSALYTKHNTSDSATGQDPDTTLPDSTGGYTDHDTMVAEIKMPADTLSSSSPSAPPATVKQNGHEEEINFDYIE